MIPKCWPASLHFAKVSRRSAGPRTAISKSSIDTPVEIWVKSKLTRQSWCVRHRTSSLAAARRLLPLYNGRPPPSRSHERHTSDVGGNLLQHLQPFPDQGKFNEGEAGDIAARMRQRRREALSNRIADDVENDTGDAESSTASDAGAAPKSRRKTG